MGVLEEAARALVRPCDVLGSTEIIFSSTVWLIIYKYDSDMNNDNINDKNNDKNNDNFYS